MLPFTNAALMSAAVANSHAGDKSFAFVDGDYMELLSFSAITGAPCTIVAWFNPDNDTDNLNICKVTTSGQDRLELGLSGSSSPDRVSALAARTSGTSASAVAGDYAPSSWQHAAAVFASSTSRTAYYNGVAGTLNASSIVSAGMDRVSIATGYSGGTRNANNMKGKLAHIAIWNMALSGTDIASLATPGTLPSSVQSGNLVFYAPLTGGIAKDLVSNTSLTLVGATSSSDGPF
jgi:hypothetical protein